MPARDVSHSSPKPQVNTKNLVPIQHAVLFVVFRDFLSIIKDRNNTTRIEMDALRFQNAMPHNVKKNVRFSTEDMVKKKYNAHPKVCNLWPFVMAASLGLIEFLAELNKNPGRRRQTYVQHKNGHHFSQIFYLSQSTMLLRLRRMRKAQNK